MRLALFHRSSRASWLGFDRGHGVDIEEGVPGVTATELGLEDCDVSLADGSDGGRSVGLSALANGSHSVSTGRSGCRGVLKEGDGVLMSRPPAAAEWKPSKGSARRASAFIAPSVFGLPAGILVPESVGDVHLAADVAAAEAGATGLHCRCLRLRKRSNKTPKTKPTRSDTSRLPALTAALASP